MRAISRSSAPIALLAAVLLAFSPAPARAQTGLVAAGHGSFLAFNGVDTLRFTFAVTGQIDGPTHGFAVWRGPNSVILWQVTSSTFLGQAVAFAGPIVAIVGTPPPGFAVGVTAFTAAQDNGPGSTDGTSSLSVVPAMFGNPTIQQIVALLAGGPPPVFLPLLSGNIWTQ